MSPAGAHRAPVVPVYVSLLLSEWGLVLYVWRSGLRRAGVPITALIGRAPRSGKSIFADVLIAAAIWGAVSAVAAGLRRIQGDAPAALVESMLPRGPLEAALWIALSLSAGFCEELVFRGYLQRQFHALTGSPWLALALQAVVFGVSHGYQGIAPCLRITLIAAFFGAVAQWRGSLRPVMMAHAWTDVAAGLLRL